MNAVSIQKEQQMVFPFFGQFDAVESIDHGQLDDLARVALRLEFLHDALGNFFFRGGGNHHFQLDGFFVDLIHLQDGEKLLILGRQAQHIDIAEHADDAGLAGYISISIIA